MEFDVYKYICDILKVIACDNPFLIFWDSYKNRDSNKRERKWASMLNKNLITRDDEEGMSQFYIFYCRINQRWKASWNMAKIFKFFFSLLTTCHFLSVYDTLWLLIHRHKNIYDKRIREVKTKISYLAYFKGKRQ